MGLGKARFVKKTGKNYGLGKKQPVKFWPLKTFEPTFWENF
jgi:hypothetical protein